MGGSTLACVTAPSHDMSQRASPDLNWIGLNLAWTDGAYGETPRASELFFHNRAGPTEFHSQPQAAKFRRT